MRPRIVRGKAKYDVVRLSLRHQKREKNFARGSERIPDKYAIVTGPSKVKLKPWCIADNTKALAKGKKKKKKPCIKIHGFLALILFTVTIPF